MKTMFRLAGIMAASILLTLTPAHAERARVYSGEISDSQCALNVHSLTRSHQEMLKSKSMGGSSASCSEYCVQRLGGQLVLSSKKDVYRLDDQEIARKFVGEKVKLTGYMKEDGRTLHVMKMEKAE